MTTNNGQWESSKTEIYQWFQIMSPYDALYSIERESLRNHM